MSVHTYFNYISNYPKLKYLIWSLAIWIFFLANCGNISFVFCFILPFLNFHCLQLQHFYYLRWIWKYAEHLTVSPFLFSEFHFYVYCLHFYTCSFPLAFLPPAVIFKCFFNLPQSPIESLFYALLRQHLLNTHQQPVHLG